MKTESEYKPISPSDHPLPMTKTVSWTPRPPFLLDEGGEEAGRRYPFRVPAAFARRVAWEDADDPLARQVLPSGEELRSVPGFADDPLEENRFQPLPGLLHKYHGRILLKITGACAIHCRYCFRRHGPGTDGPRSLTGWQPALRYIHERTELREVIFSGGDPLMVDDSRLSALVGALAAIPHLTRLRIHSRMPVVTPERINDSLVHWLTGTRLTPMMVIHANHPAELDPTARAALARLIDAGIPVLNQAVLLHGVNDRVETLIELSERLADARVRFYYLHLLDPVAGAAHFRVAENRALELIDQLRAQLPGHAVPTLVREEPGAAAKSVR